MAKYDLIFTGEVSEGCSLEKVKENFKNHFKLNNNKLKLLFSGKSITIKKNLDQHKLLEMLATIDQLGGVAYFEELQDDISLPESVSNDRRKGKRRLHIDRRHGRKGNFERRINHRRNI